MAATPRRMDLSHGLHFYLFCYVTTLHNKLSLGPTTLRPGWECLPHSKEKKKIEETTRCLISRKLLLFLQVL